MTPHLTRHRRSSAICGSHEPASTPTTSSTAYPSPCGHCLCTNAPHDSTRNLGRNLPSGSELFGLLAFEDQNRILSNIVGRHHTNGDWLSHCRTWEPVIADPVQTGRNSGPQQRLHWLTIPVDSGRLGRTVTGKAEKLGNWVIGRDPDSDTSLAAYSALAHEITSALPDEFHVTAATPAQILWHHRHNMLRGAFTAPLPDRRVGPHELSAEPFGRWWFDEGANSERLNRWWPSRRSLVRIQELDAHGQPTGPVSYQAMLAVDQYPARGVRFPKASYLRALDNVDTPAIVDWVQHLNLRTPDQALAANRRNAKNIKDQQQQRAAKRDDADAEDLANKLDGTLDYSSELNANPTERELDGTTIIAVGAASIEIVEDAVKQIRQELDSAAIAFSRYRGSHQVLWKAFNPGSETKRSQLDQFRNPTTAHRWSRFMPLTSDDCGNSTGSPLAVSQNTEPAPHHPARPRRHRPPQPQHWLGHRRRARIRKIQPRQALRRRTRPAPGPRAGLRPRQARRMGQSVPLVARSAGHRPHPLRDVTGSTGDLPL